jgi:hypothetical protein
MRDSPLYQFFLGKILVAGADNRSLSTKLIHSAAFKRRLSINPERSRRIDLDASG